MSAKLSLLRSALLAPMDHFTTLWKRVRPTGREVITVDASYSFAEVIVPTAESGRILIFLPLTTAPLNNCPQLISPPSSMLCPYRVLKDELVSATEQCDIIVQPIPGGDTLNISPIDSISALQKIDILEKECRRIGFSHNRLTPEDIIVGNDDRLYPIRYHHATMDGCKDDFNVLRALFLDRAEEESILKDVNSSYTSRYCEIFDRHNGYIRFCDDGLYGYKDYKGEDVIDAQYLWAGDFCERRAIVETDFGFGVINHKGEFVIKPYLSSLYYDTYNSIFYYYENDKLYAFDYNGTPLHPDNPMLSHLKR